MFTAEACRVTGPRKDPETKPSMLGVRYGEGDDSPGKVQCFGTDLRSFVGNTWQWIRWELGCNIWVSV